MKYLMGIDNGGTFVKAGLVDENGGLVAVAREPIENQTPKPGFTERDMDALWEQNAKVVRAAVEKSGLPILESSLRTPGPGSIQNSGKRTAQPKKFMKRPSRIFWPASR